MIVEAIISRTQQKTLEVYRDLHGIGSLNDAATIILSDSLCHLDNGQVAVSVAFDSEILMMIDQYIYDLRRKGIHTNRSAFLNAAALETIQRRREEEAGKGDGQ